MRFYPHATLEGASCVLCVLTERITAMPMPKNFRHGRSAREPRASRLATSRRTLMRSLETRYDAMQEARRVSRLCAYQVFRRNRWTRQRVEWHAFSGLFCANAAVSRRL